MRPIVAIVLAGCLERPFEPYFEDPADGPTLDGVVADPSPGLLGGARAELRGARLQSTRTVVVGGRNARVLEAHADRVVVELPSHAQASGPLDVAVVTDFGVTRMDAAIELGSPLGDFAAEERVSAALARVDCPIEAYVWDGEFIAPLLWCGAEFGYADGIGFSGSGVHPGFASDVLELAPLGQAPPPGQARHWGPGDRRPPTAPVIVGPHASGDAIHLRTPHDFARDVALLEERLEWVAERYYWAGNIDPDSIRRVATVFDAEGAEVGRGVIATGEGDRLELSEPAPAGAAAVWTGFRFVERYPGDPEVYETVAWTGAARVSADGTGLRAAGDAGADLVYDEFSGYFFPSGVAGLFAQSEVVRADYTVSTSRAGALTEHGTIEGLRPLRLLTPDLMSGLVVLRTDAAVEIHWDPAPETDDPVLVVAELKVYDLDVRDPNYQLELHRITATARDADGRLRFPADLVARLPERVENTVDLNYDSIGLWGDLTVARHALRKVPLATGEGDAVVDLIHAVTGPVVLVR